MAKAKVSVQTGSIQIPEPDLTPEEMIARAVALRLATPRRGG